LIIVGAKINNYLREGNKIGFTLSYITISVKIINECHPEEEVYI
jgi:hypothetical protein